MVSQRREKKKNGGGGGRPEGAGGEETVCVGEEGGWETRPGEKAEKTYLRL